MKFEGYLYDVIESADAGTSEESCQFVIALRPDSPVYGGHFPGFPVTPGVALLTVVRELLESRLHKPLALASADDVKFLRPLTPEDNPVTVTFREFSDTGVKAEISGPAALHARMTLSYRSQKREDR